MSEELRQGRGLGIKHWRDMITPRRQGRSAFKQGYQPTANPYEIGTITARSWATGYATEAAKEVRQTKP